MIKSRRRSPMRLATIPLAIALLMSARVGVAMAASIAPPTAYTGPVKSILPTSVVVTGTVNPNGAETSWYFQYGLSSSASFTSRTLTKSAGSGSDDVKVKHSLTGLAPATSYSYRIVAMNSAGTTVGGVGIFNTSAPPVVLTGAAGYISSTSSTLNGVINPEALATSWYFQYGITTVYGSKTPTKQIAANHGDTVVSEGISALKPNTSYHFRVVAKSIAGTSVGADFMFTTGLSVSLNSSVPNVIYGEFVTLSGKVSSGIAGVRVAVMSEAFDHTAYSDIATVVTTGGGTWSFSAQPTARTTFNAIANGGSSSPVVISVAPRVFLNVVSGGRLLTRVVAGVSFADHVLQLQRLSKGLWVTWKHVRLNSLSKAVFSTSLPKGVTTIRMAIGPFVPGIDQAAPGYVAGYSRSIQYRR